MRLSSQRNGINSLYEPAFYRRDGLHVGFCGCLGVPGCEYERLLRNHWNERFLALNCILPVAVSAARLDPVRALYAFIPYSYFAYWLHGYLIWYTWDNPLGLVLGPVWAANVIGVGVLMLLGRFTFFRKQGQTGIARWQLVTYAAASLVVNFILLR
jgi:hypothetical protein